jgi:hypothetical protein
MKPHVDSVVPYALVSALIAALVALVVALENGRVATNGTTRAGRIAQGQVASRAVRAYTAELALSGPQTATLGSVAMSELDGASLGSSQQCADKLDKVRDHIRDGAAVTLVETAWREALAAIREDVRPRRIGGALRQ